MLQEICVCRFNQGSTCGVEGGWWREREGGGGRMGAVPSTALLSHPSSEGVVSTVATQVLWTLWRVPPFSSRHLATPIDLQELTIRYSLVLNIQWWNHWCCLGNQWIYWPTSVMTTTKSQNYLRVYAGVDDYLSCMLRGTQLSSRALYLASPPLVLFIPLKLQPQQQKGQSGMQPVGTCDLGASVCAIMRWTVLSDLLGPPFPCPAVIGPSTCSVSGYLGACEFDGKNENHQVHSWK